MNTWAQIVIISKIETKEMNTKSSKEMNTKSSKEMNTKSSKEMNNTKLANFSPAIHYFLMLLFVNILNWFKTKNIRLRLHRAEHSSVV